MFTGFDRTPDAALGDTSGDTDHRGELSNTQPLFVALSQDNRTVVILVTTTVHTAIKAITMPLHACLCAGHVQLRHRLTKVGMRVRDIDMVDVTIATMVMVRVRQ